MPSLSSAYFRLRIRHRVFGMLEQNMQLWSNLASWYSSLCINEESEKEKASGISDINTHMPALKLIVWKVKLISSN